MTQGKSLYILGGGLSGLLTAWRCLDQNPELTITIIEASDKLAGDHTWSFNLTDIAEGLRDWIKPFIAYKWDNYEVSFPQKHRILDISYCTGNSDTLRACIKPFLEEGRLKVRLNTKVDRLEDDQVILANEEVLASGLIIDARGFEPSPKVHLGYQKFVGHVIKTKIPHGVERPIIMDATVPQLGGYRFVYCLPYTETEILVEDTYYTDGEELNSQEVDSRIKAYIADSLKITSYEVLRREKGVLPITLAASENSFDNRSIGIKGGFYHAVTGYSFPDALKTAEEISSYMLSKKDVIAASKRESLQPFISRLQGRHYKSERFFRLLNRMLFRAAKADERYIVLQRFYGLNESLIERFYAGELRWVDKVRILIGKPPVPIIKALQNFSEPAFIRRENKKGET